MDRRDTFLGRMTGRTIDQSTCTTIAWRRSNVAEKETLRQDKQTHTDGQIDRKTGTHNQIDKQTFTEREGD